MPAKRALAGLAPMVQVELRAARRSCRTSAPETDPRRSSGTNRTLLASPKIAAASARQKSTSKPVHWPRSSRFENPGRPSLTPQTSAPARLDRGQRLRGRGGRGEGECERRDDGAKAASIRHFQQSAHSEARPAFEVRQISGKPERVSACKSLARGLPGGPPPLSACAAGIKKERTPMSESEIDAVRALLTSKPRPVGWTARRERLDEVGAVWPVAADIAVEAVNAGGAPGEFSLAPGSDPSGEPCCSFTAGAIARVRSSVTGGWLRKPAAPAACDALASATGRPRTSVPGRARRRPRRLAVPARDGATRPKSSSAATARAPD